MASRAHQDPSRRLVRTHRIQLHARHFTEARSGGQVTKANHRSSGILWRSGIGGVNGRLLLQKARSGALRVRQIVAISICRAGGIRGEAKGSMHLSLNRKASQQ
jgi:hypothetical protein